MKTLAALLLTLVLFVGCTPKDRIILVPQSQDYPTFNTTDFKLKQSFPLEVWEEEDENGKYIVGKEQHVLEFIKWSKQNRSDYNVLLKQLNNFNKRIIILNDISKNKQPQEVQKIKDSDLK